MITLLCGIKILAVCSTVSSQSTRVTDGLRDGQNYDPQDRTSIAASRGKNVSFMHSLQAYTVVFTMFAIART